MPPTLPPALLPLLALFAPHFSRRVWPHALILLVGAIRAPGRRTVAAAVADATYAALAFLARCRSWPRPVPVITRLRLDAALSEPAPPRWPRQTGRPRLKGARLPTLATVAADPRTAWTPVVVAPGTAGGRAASTSRRARRSGTAPACRRCRCAEC